MSDCKHMMFVSIFENTDEQTYRCTECKLTYIEIIATLTASQARLKGALEHIAAFKWSGCRPDTEQLVGIAKQALNEGHGDEATHGGTHGTD